MYLNFNGLKRIGILFTILILTGCSNVIWHQTQVGLNCGPTTLANVLNHRDNTILTGDAKTGLYSISDSLMGTYKDKIDNYYGFWIKF